jgi:hypothetical protein
MIDKTLEVETLLASIEKLREFVQKNDMHKVMIDDLVTAREHIDVALDALMRTIRR